MTEQPTGGRGRGLTLAASAVLLLVGLVAIVYAVLGQQGDPPTPDGSAGLTTVQETPEPPTQDETQAPSAEPAPDAAATSVEPEIEPEAVAPGPTEEEPTVEALPASEPVSIDIPGIEVTSGLHPLGLNDDGSLQVPSGELYDQAAWYDGSPTPGEVGPAVIEGHVTSQGSVPSVFFDLGALEPGDTVDVDREDGSTATFEVYAINSFPKDEFPKAAVYGNTDVPELRLITCGGEYDEQARAHVDNIVVFARMVPTA